MGVPLSPSWSDRAFPPCAPRGYWTVEVRRARETPNSQPYHVPKWYFKSRLAWDASNLLPPSLSNPSRPGNSRVLYSVFGMTTTPSCYNSNYLHPHIQLPFADTHPPVAAKPLSPSPLVASTATARKHVRCYPSYLSPCATISRMCQQIPSSMCCAG